MSGVATAAEVPAGVSAVADGAAGTVSQADSWDPPAGYVGHSTYAKATECEARGKKGIAEGTWSAYLCHPIPLGVEMPIYLHGLYVKK
ncbi:hypothetical protein ACWD6P_17515 [Streptomyces sp. NPDC002446]